MGSSSTKPTMNKAERLLQSLDVLEESFTPSDEISIAHYLKSVVGMRDIG